MLTGHSWRKGTDLEACTSISSNYVQEISDDLGWREDLKFSSFERLLFISSILQDLSTYVLLLLDS